MGNSEVEVQYMNRERGIQELREAIVSLAKAGASLHEFEDGRYLISTYTAMIGGLTDTASALADLLEDTRPVELPEGSK